MYGVDRKAFPLVRSFFSPRGNDVGQLRDAPEHLRQLRQTRDRYLDPHVSDVVAFVGDCIHAPDADLVVRQCGADITHQSAAIERLDIDLHREFVRAHLAPGDRQHPCRRLDADTGEVGAGLRVNADTPAHRDVADDGLGRYGFAAARVGGQQIADALDLDVRLPRGRRAFGANGVLRTDFARVENALDGSRHLRGADLAQPQGFVQGFGVG